MKPALSFLAPSALLSLALVATASGQTTWIVDDDPGPGVDFNDLPPAIAASGPWDTIIVRGGWYSSTVIDHGVRIIGRAPIYTRLASPLQIRDIPAGQMLIVANLSSSDLVEVRDCDGLVVLEDVEAMRFEVEASHDVRMQRVEAWNPDPGQESRIVGSRVEIVDSLFQGHWGYDGNCDDAEDGELGLDVVASFVHLAASRVRGGPGGYCNENPLGCCIGTTPADGGDGLDAIDSQVVVSGLGGGEGVYGGTFGQVWHIYQQAGCPCGDYGRGLFAAGSPTSQPSVRLSDAVTSGWPGLSLGAGVSLTQASGDPVLRLGGPAIAGQPVVVELYGTPGERIQLEFGRNAVRTPVAGSPIEQLTSAQRRGPLGNVPPSGMMQVVINVPMHWPPGTVFFLQSRLTDPTNGSTRMSNSAPFLVR